ncbi:MAG: ParB N-terminal domain-containing protein [Paenibacillus macerans]|uniref:ParB-like nuclease domain protein n=1 Tax=Paenibacillus macerans TaxID=44252 RepID=A0A090ZNH3_PAEMA|nr:ParB N-terminal domain-containing protein [Paenibacillus macerans]KFN12132.1 parB-like nuclease domain protein [Paenibacillus macerans]MCY7558289.1 ParB N-terminal domain-containing protein [Paenibacillus macerans]MDU7472202.1 ParB N-terminal domain-containing protein [Paenibacillus macerans]MEC0150275.1 ParB N-terminal domain-containing protein [Paenibacillus macerans]MEC0332018.1 ParB N-terminal domain-containing protein [Paenibacillus macerans]
MAGKRPVPKLASIDELLLLSEQPSEPSAPSVQSGGIQTIPISKIRMYKDHPFRLYEDERLTDMADSIQVNGVLVPVIIRKIEPDENGCEYEMLAGHNRMNAAGMVGLDHLPCIVKENLSDEEALMYVVETNVLQRSFSEMLPSEKAKVLSLRYSDMFSQGKRNDIIEELQKLENPQYIKENPTSPLVGAKLRTDEKLGIEYGLSKNTVARLLRINHLTIELKRRVDDAEIGIYPAVDLSYLSEAEQRLVDGLLSGQGYKVDMKKSSLLREYSGKLTDEQVVRILSGEATRKPRSKTPAPFKLKHKVYAKYFSPQSKASEVEEIIDKALGMYFAHQRQQHQSKEIEEDDHANEV